MPSGIDFHVRELVEADAAAVQSCFDSQDKIMLHPKQDRHAGYGSSFLGLLRSGCRAFGAFAGDELRAFSVVFRWPDLPIATLLLMQNRPTTGPYNASKSGLRQAMDASLHHLEAAGCTTFFWIRADDPKFSHANICRGQGRLAEYHTCVVERVKAGQVSKLGGIAGMVMGGLPAIRDVVVLQGMVPDRPAP